MHKKIYASFLLAALFWGAALLVSARPAGRELLAQLPASDFIVAADLQRLQSETLPALGTANAMILADINREMAKFQKETGLDPRSFESAAAGVRMSDKNPENFVLLLQGGFDAAGIIETGFAKAQEKNSKVKREAQQYEGFTIWLVKEGKSRQAQRLAIVALDGNTVAFGDVSLVRQTLDARLGRGARASDELVNLATRAPALVSFAGDVPAGLFNELRGPGKDETQFMDLAKSVRRVAGALNANGLNVDGQFSLFTETAGQANELASTLNGFKLLFGSMRSGGASRKAEDEILRRLVNALQVTSQNNEVQLRLSVPESDVRQLLGNS